MRPLVSVLTGAVLVLLGGLGAHLVQTSGGVEVRDVRVPLLQNDGSLSALLYVPDGASRYPRPWTWARAGPIPRRARRRTKNQ